MQDAQEIKIFLVLLEAYHNSELKVYRFGENKKELNSTKMLKSSFFIVLIYKILQKSRMLYARGPPGFMCCTDE